MRLSIRYKVFLSFLFGMVIVVILSNGFTYLKYKNLLIEQIKNDVNNVMLENKRSFDNIVSQIKRSGDYIGFNEFMIQALFSDTDNDINRTAKVLNYGNEFKNMYHLALGPEKYNYLAFYANEELPFAENLRTPNLTNYTPLGIYSTKGLSERKWYQNTLRKQGSLYTFRISEYPEILYLSKAVKNEGASLSFSEEYLGISVVGVDMTYILKSMNRLAITEKMCIAVLDSENKLICKSQTFPDDAFIQKTVDEHPIPISDVMNFTQNGLVINMIKTDIGISIVSFVSLKEIYSKAAEIKYIMLTAIALAAIVTLLISCGFSYGLTQPIKKLSNVMRNAKGEGIIAARVAPLSNDEVGDLYHSFNQLMEQTSGLIKEVENKSMLAKQLEMQMFQLQINPHFLYNTLDTIFWIAMLHNQEDIAKMIKWLSDIFRYSVKDGSALASLNEEITAVENYVMIQQKRYEDVFDLDCVIPAEYEKVQVPKCILQPLVENAILHGIADTDRKIHISISVSKTENKFEIRIKDNGVGCDVQQLNAYLKGEKNGFSTDGMGSYNVNKRIQLKYGSTSGLHYEDNEKDGITAVITMTLIEGNQEVDGL